MKAKHVILYLLLAIVSFSCIGEEALNAEADILSCALPGVAMTTSPIINNNSITIFVGPGTDISELTPEFTLTPGATINPLSGTKFQYSTRIYCYSCRWSLEENVYHIRYRHGTCHEL